MRPLVTVICLCYNHEKFVRKAVESVIRQTYKPVQIILRDDASTDGSALVIQALKNEYPFLETTLSPVNQGNCRAFNTAYAHARGSYVVDFATDDIMNEYRLEKQLTFFEQQGKDVGVVFTDASYIDEGGNFLRDHFEYLYKHKIIRRIPSGDVYKDVLSTYFIATPTMMIRREVLEYLGGYDEELAYEDFDFVVRSSRDFKYGFLNEKLTLIRKLATSMSATQYAHGDKQLHSTYLVCRKAKLLNRNVDEDNALIKRVRYEFRQAALYGKREEAHLFYEFLKELKGVTGEDHLLRILHHSRISLRPLMKIYH